MEEFYEYCIKRYKRKIQYYKRRYGKKLKITRQTYYKYESGESELTLDVVKKIANTFSVDYNDIIENRIPQNIEYNIVEGKKNNKKEVAKDIRIDIPQENIEKFKQIFLYIINKIGSKPNVGQAVLYKLLYFIDFDYYELFEEQLMGLKYIKNDFGPTPASFAKVIKQMEKDSLLEEVKTKRFDYNMTKYLPLVEADLSNITAKEIKFIDEVIDKHGFKSAKELTELSHKNIPWIGTKTKEIIPYESRLLKRFKTLDKDIAYFKQFVLEPYFDKGIDDKSSFYLAFTL